MRHTLQHARKTVVVKTKWFTPQGQRDQMSEVKERRMTLDSARHSCFSDPHISSLCRGPNKMLTQRNNVVWVVGHARRLRTPRCMEDHTAVSHAFRMEQLQNQSLLQPQVHACRSMTSQCSFKMRCATRRV